MRKGIVLLAALALAGVASCSKDTKTTEDGAADTTADGAPDATDGGERVDGPADATGDGGDLAGDEREVPLTCGDSVVDAGEECDDGNGIDGDGCDGDCTFSCHGNAECDDGHACTTDQCDLVLHRCAILIAPGGTPCGPVAGSCDRPEYCDGVGPDCPADAFVEGGTPCRGSAGVCDVEETCTGTAGACPADGFVAAGTACRAGVDTCDAVETCTGAGAECPADALKPEGAECSDGEYCTLPDQCSLEGECTPGDAVTALHGIRAVSGGEAHTCAVTSAGGVKCWGANEFGQLGNGTTNERRSPVDVSGLAAGAAMVECGYTFTCAATAAGAAKCWGLNDRGQLGDGTTAGKATPVGVAGLSSGVAGVAAGRYHACAVTTGGAAFCWGWNEVGQLGDGTTSQRRSPVLVAGLSTGAAAVAAGSSHTCALTAAGGVKCWGYNNSGQLGIGAGGDRTSPVDVAGLSSGAAAVAAGSYHTCAVTAAGALLCWGANNDGQLGDNTTATRNSPVAVSGLTAGVLAVGAGLNHTCALVSGGGVKCWGNNWDGQVGDGTNNERHTPVNVAGLTAAATAVGLGLEHSCAVASGGILKCWGDNANGRLGLGPGVYGDRSSPVSVLCN